MGDDKKSMDILGVKPLAEAVQTVTKGAVDGAAAFFSRICLPAAEEFGLLLKDRVSHWRMRNLVAITEKTQQILGQHSEMKPIQVHPRILNDIIDKGSWSEEDDLQSMWAGLLAASCTQDGKDESSLIFITLLAQLTSGQARLLNYGCETAVKKLSLDNLLYAEKVTLSAPELIKIWQDQDLHRIDRELDHLHGLGLIEGGFPLHDAESALPRAGKNKSDAPQQPKPAAKTEVPAEVGLPPVEAEVTPRPITLHLYVRCQGCRTSPAEFFRLVLCP